MDVEFYANSGTLSECLFIVVVVGFFCRSVPENYICQDELKLNTEAENMYEEEEEHDEEEEEMMEREEKSEKTMTKKKKSNRQRWTDKEIEEINIYFKKFLETGTTPRSVYIEKMKKTIKKNGGIVHLRANHLIIKKISNMNASKRSKNTR